MGDELLTQPAKCSICGKRPAEAVEHGVVFCATHASAFRVSLCESCGAVCVSRRSAPLAARCSSCDALVRLRALPTESASALEQLVRDRRWMEAILHLRRVDPSLGLYDAQELVAAQKRRLGVSTDPPLPSVDELHARVAAMRPAALTLESAWDGDTVHDWFVTVFATAPDPNEPGQTLRHEIVSVTASHGPPTALAAEIAGELAERLGIPYVAHPGEVDEL